MLYVLVLYKTIPYPAAMPSIPTRPGRVPVSLQAIAETLVFPLRYDGRGKPYPSGWEFVAVLVARLLA